MIVAHSSDLHIGLFESEDLSATEAVIATARIVGAQVLVLAGDVFEHNGLSLRLLDSVTRILGDAGMEVVILPGNHDCLTPDSVYRRGGISEPANVHVLGVTADEQLLLPALDLGVWGRPHRDYADLFPLRDAPGRRLRWQIATAHGHWLTSERDLYRGWLIRDEELAAVDADYVALGHWDVPTRVHPQGRTPAYYSGSPHLAQSINVVRLGATVSVERAPLLESDAAVDG